MIIGISDAGYKAYLARVIANSVITYHRYFIIMDLIKTCKGGAKLVLDGETYTVKLKSLGVKIRRIYGGGVVRVP